MFSLYRQKGTAHLVISGPYEFLADDPFVYGHRASGSAKNSMPDKAAALVALASHNLLRVDVGWLSSKAAKWLRDASGSLPNGYLEVSQKPVTRILDSKAGAIGVVLFPEGKIPGQGPSQEQIREVLTAAEAIRGKVRLLVGVSPWGYVAERNFISKDARGVFGCIMGGGEGVGFSHSLQENPGVLWLRPDTQGRTVNVLEILELPALGESPRWKENTTFRASLEFLDGSFPSDPQMRNIIGNP